MKLKQFVQEVQSRAHFRSEKEAVTAIQATLQTFGERLSPPEADELAAQLPGEIASYILLNQELPATPPSATGFFKRIALREGVDISMAVVHTRAVLGAIQKSCNDQTQTVAQSFPWPDITPLFEKVVFGSGRANGSMAAPAMS